MSISPEFVISALSIMVLSGLVGALIDRWFSGAHRLESNERFRTGATVVGVFVYLIMAVSTGYFQIFVALPMVDPLASMQRLAGTVRLIALANYLVLTIMVILPIFASRHISNAKLRRWFLVASFAMLVIGPTWFGVATALLGH